MTDQTDTPRAISAEEVRAIFLDHVRGVVRYWANLPDLPNQDRCEGVAFSILTTIDGCAGGFPCALDLVCRPHPDDKAFQVDEGENWIEDGMVINDCQLHESFYAPKD